MHIKPIHLLAIILTLATIYFYQDPQSNGASRLDATRAIVERGNFQIDTFLKEPYWGAIDKAFYKGHYYTDKAIGTSLFAVLPYWILYKYAALVGMELSSTLIKHWLTTLIIGASFVINGIFLYKITQLISPNSAKAFIATLAISLGTMLWPFSEVYYGHVPAAMFLTIAFYCLFSLKETPDVISWGKFFGAGLALGFAYITDYTTALIIAGLMVYAIYILRKQSRLNFFRYGFFGFIGALIPLSFMFAYNFSVYGNIFAISYVNEASVVLQQGPDTRLIGYIALPNLSTLYHISFDPKFGLFWQSPVLILAFVGYFLAIKTKLFQAETWLSIYSVASIFIMNAGLWTWWGGSTFGPRYLIVALPFFIIPLMLVPDSLMWLLGSLTVVSIAQMLIPLVSQIQIGLDFDITNGKFTINGPFTGFSILYNYGIHQIYKLYAKHTYPWTLGNVLGLRPRYSVLALMALEAFLVGFSLRKLKMISAQQAR